MGTRTDYYIGNHKDMTSLVWLGSSAYDGYPTGQSKELLYATGETSFKRAVASRLTKKDATKPEQGWPWPWRSSHLTDYVYLFDTELQIVLLCHFSRGWFTLDQYNQCEDMLSKEEKLPDDLASLYGPFNTAGSNDGPLAKLFPDMSDLQKVTLGARSGLLIIGS